MTASAHIVTVRSLLAFVLLWQWTVGSGLCAMRMLAWSSVDLATICVASDIDGKKLTTGDQGPVDQHRTVAHDCDLCHAVPTAPAAHPSVLSSAAPWIVIVTINDTRSWIFLPGPRAPPPPSRAPPGISEV